MTHQNTILFVTGRLAAPALEPIVRETGERNQVATEIVVLGINVAALMHVDWVARKLEVPEHIQQVILPGWCQGDLEKLSKKWGVPVLRGPKDLRDLPRWFDKRDQEPPDLSKYDIEILAEINGAPLLKTDELLRIAISYANRGANLIDYGCLPGPAASQVGEHIRELRQAGFRVSIDSFDQQEVEAAVEAGAELILSANSTNLDWVTQLGTEVVAIPDDFQNLDTFEPILDRLEKSSVPYRLDPILEPVGFGFAASLARYYETRRRWPHAEMMMGVGNITELAEVDSAGVNFILAALCQELGIRSVLTTEVINWARESVKEFDLARRMTHYAINEKQLPKHINAGLLSMRDPRVHQLTEEELNELTAQIRDPNYRIFATEDALHLINRDGHFQGNDPFQLFQQAVELGEITPSHAFYLGYELAQAETAKRLGKQYTQDEPLNWGHLTRSEKHLSLKPTFRKSPDSKTSDS